MEDRNEMVPATRSHSAMEDQRRSQTQTMEFFTKVEKPIETIEKVGSWLEQSRLFGAKNKEQGIMLAMCSLIYGYDLMKLSQSYHLIEGNFTLKYRKMVAKFLQYGGKVHVIERSPNRACSKLSIGGQEVKFVYTMAEALQEDYIWTRDAMTGRVKKQLKDGTPNPKAFKTNWSTPRRQMQMLWARMMTDGIATIAAHVTDGDYSDQEFASFSGDVDASDEVVLEAGEVVDATFEVMDVPANKSEAEPVVEAEPAPAVMPTEQDAEAAINADQVKSLRELKTALDLDSDAWSEVLAKYNVGSAKQLTFDQADSLCVTLMRMHKEKELLANQEDFATQ